MKMINKLAFMGLFAASSLFSGDVLSQVRDWQNLPRTEAWDVEENGYTFECCYSAIKSDSLFEDLYDYLDEENVSAHDLDTIQEEAAFLGQHASAYKNIPQYLGIWNSSCAESPSSIKNNIDFGRLLGRAPNASTRFKRNVSEILDIQEDINEMSWIERLFSPNVYADMFREIETASQNAAFANEASICNDNHAFSKGMTSACCEAAADISREIDNYRLIVQHFSRDNNGILEFNGFGQQDDAFDMIFGDGVVFPFLLEREWPAYVSTCEGLPGSIYTVDQKLRTKNFTAMEEVTQAYLAVLADVNEERRIAREQERQTNMAQFYDVAEDIFRQFDAAILGAVSGLAMQVDNNTCTPQ